MAHDAYVTMLLSDDYLLGAQVLAASLRDGGTTKRLAVIVPADEAHRLLPSTIAQLEQSFDYVIPMPVLATANYSSLRLMDRPDLALTLTKINLWRLTQFRKCVYLDADVLALRAPDELFNLDVDFAAAPDIGWPDIFNSGVFLFRPDLGTYHALKTLAESGITFDGGDQGLLNTFFPAYHRLSFTYNVTPSTHYQYTPAYRHFASNISMFHFIGKSKPWNQRSYSAGGYSEATSRWWAVYERHYGWKIREDEYKRSQESALRKGRDRAPRQEYSASQPTQAPIQAPTPTLTQAPSQAPSRPSSSRSTKQVSFAPDMTFYHPTPPQEIPASSAFADAPRPPSPERMASPEQPPPQQLPQQQPPPPPPSPPPREVPPPREPSPPPFEPTLTTWDPARSAPPLDAGPEAQSLTISAFESAWDKPYDPEEPKWVPPPPAPLPKGYEYTPPVAPHKHYDSSEDESESESETTTVVPPSSWSDSESPETPPMKEERFNPIFPWEMKDRPRTATRVFPGDTPPATVKGKSVEAPQPDPGRRPSLDDYQFTNAWDSLPIIQTYVKQKLGDAPQPEPKEMVIKPKVESPITPMPVPVLATSTLVSAMEGEHWDPNRSLDKLKTGVMSKVLEQQQQQRATNATESKSTAESSPPELVDEGN